MERRMIAEKLFDRTWKKILLVSLLLLILSIIFGHVGGL